MTLFRYRLDGGAWVEVDADLPYEITATSQQDVEVQGLGTILISEGIGA